MVEVMEAAAMEVLEMGDNEEEDPKGYPLPKHNQPRGRSGAQSTGPGAGWSGPEAGPTGPETGQAQTAQFCFVLPRFAPILCVNVCECSDDDMYI